MALDADEGRFNAFDQRRRIVFKAFIRKQGSADVDELAEVLASRLENELPDECEPLEQFAHRTQKMVRMGVLFKKTEEAEALPFRLVGFLGKGPDVAQCCIDLADLSLRGWAMELWQTIAFANVIRGGDASEKS